ncbi:hypothetical protein E2C01_009920 [Portunus trituberculatus]|uniref:Uncharacterized protein n=1 Tax=Portunus trituberculatus TaxID=210409 RepID=A0A5B7D726_PORTR|nr:hypothetical protein [Portunus trituberculatus]
MLLSEQRDSGACRPVSQSRALADWLARDRLIKPRPLPNGVTTTAPLRPITIAKALRRLGIQSKGSFSLLFVRELTNMGISKRKRVCGTDTKNPAILPHTGTKTSTVESSAPPLSIPAPHAPPTVPARRLHPYILDSTQSYIPCITHILVPLLLHSKQVPSFPTSPFPLSTPRMPAFRYSLSSCPTTPTL